VSQWLTAKKKPGELLCLAIATLAAKGDIPYWVDLSGLTHEQLMLIAQTLNLPEPTILSGEEREILAWWRDTNPNAPEKGQKAAVKALLEARRAGWKFD
jgi:hypothetical protein